MSAHTPGPWIASAEDVLAGDDWVCGCNFATMDGKANARLIAAAPELLSALQTSACPRPANVAPDGLTVHDCLARGECACDLGDAIAKATGAA
jgi:hypothetical protein